MRVSWCVVAMIFLAGCADDPTPVADTQEAPGPGPVPAVDFDVVEGNLTKPTRSFDLRARGDPGEWIVVHIPFAHPTQSIGFEYRLDAQASPEGDGSGAFLWPLGLTRVGPDGGFSMDRGNVFREQYITFRASQQHWQEDASVGAGSSESFAGLMVAFAAQSAWTLSLALHCDAELRPATVLQGNNATFAHGAQTLLPVPGAGPVNQVSLDVAVPGEGWSHLEMVRQKVEPIAASQVDLALPNGYQQGGLGTVTGYYVPMLMGSASSSGRIDYIGSLRDIAGTATADVTYAEVSLFLEFGYVHMPFGPDDFPGLGEADYFGSTWPFMDPDLPDPP